MSEQQLCAALQDHLNWEPEMVESIVASLKQAAVRNQTADIEDIIQNYMGGDMLCRAAVEVYAAEVLSQAAGPGFAPVQPKRGSTNAVFGTTRSAADAQPPRNGAARLPGSKPHPAHETREDAGLSVTRQRAAPQQQAPAPAPVRAAAVTSRSTTKAVKSAKGGKALPAELPFATLALSALERRVFNCLGCGKVYDCREETQEALDLMNLRGACVFCGRPVPCAASACAKAAKRGNATSASGASEASVPGPSGVPSDAASAAEAAAAKARDFKDRMVEYDRTAAKRTAVIDDQGDYYEIESNAWLTPEERQQAKAQVAIEDKAREERKNRLVVTVDLIGRQVITEDPQKVHDGATFEREQVQDRAAVAAAATRAVMPQGGGTAARAAEAAAAGRSQMRNLRITPAVPVGSAPPVFLPEKAAEVRAKRAGKSQRDGPRGPAAGLQRAEAKGVWAKHTQTVEVENVFDQFAEDVEVLFQETLAAEAAADEEIGRRGHADVAAGSVAA